MKYTPGPWISSKFGFQVLTGDSWNTICELKGPAEWEDGRGSYEQEYAGQMQEANARLIAAAPELLEALTLASQSAGFQYMTFETRSKIDAAIAKAESQP